MKATTNQPFKPVEVVLRIETEEELIAIVAAGDNVVAGEISTPEITEGQQQHVVDLLEAIRDAIETGTGER